MNSTSSFLMLASASSVLLLGLLGVSAVVGSMRRRAGVALSDEIEAAAGMQNRWLPRARAEGAGFDALRAPAARAEVTRSDADEASAPSPDHAAA